MGLDIEIEAAQPVAPQRIRSTLQHYATRAISLDHWAHDPLEQPNVRVVIYPILQRHIQRIVLPGPTTHIVPVPRPREEVVLVILVERERHDPIRREEGLLDAIAVVHVNVDIEHSRVHAQQLEDREHNVVDVAEAGGFGLFGVVQAAGPVYGDVGLAVDEFFCGVERGAGVERAVVPDAVEDGAVVADVEFCEVGGELFGVFGGDAGLVARTVRYRCTTPQPIPISS